MSANIRQDCRKGRKQPEWKGKYSRRIISSKTNFFSTSSSSVHLHCSWELLPWWETDIWQKRSQTDWQGKTTSKQNVLERSFFHSWHFRTSLLTSVTRKQSLLMAKKLHICNMYFIHLSATLRFKVIFVQFNRKPPFPKDSYFWST